MFLTLVVNRLAAVKLGSDYSWPNFWQPHPKHEFYNWQTFGSGLEDGPDASVRSITGEAVKS